MGGTIRIIKKENGKLKSYEGWTNPVPVFTYANKFYKDKEYASNKIQNWSKSEDKNPNFNRSEYGIIFIDLDSKRIYECQGYSSIGRCHKSSISLALSPNCSGYEYVLEGSKEFISDGALTYKSDIYDKVNGDYILESSSTQYINSYEDLISIADKGKLFRKYKSKDRFINDDFYIDFSKYGWEVNSWMDSEPFEFFSKLIDDGYDISTTDFGTWDRDEGNLKGELLSTTRDNKLNQLI